MHPEDITLGSEARRAQEIAFKKTGKEAARYTRFAGWKDVGEGQRVYVIEWGNPDGKPFMVLHGGPGQAFNSSHVALFNGETDHVIFFDQRGCGESTPSAATLNKDEAKKINTPFHIIRDMEVLRQEFGFNQMNLAGGSWGSTLALLYAIEQPERTASMALWSMYLGTKKETDGLFSDQTGDPTFKFGKEWERFIAMVPEKERGVGSDGLVDPRKVLAYYGKMVNSPDREVARKFAVEYAIYEFTLCAPDDPSTIVSDVEGDTNAVSAARIETMYLSEDLFIPENYILNNIDTIKHIPIATAQGVRDRCTPIKHARAFEEAYGKECVIEIQDSGHLRDDKNMKVVLRGMMASVPPIESVGEVQ